MATAKDMALNSWRSAKGVLGYRIEKARKAYERFTGPVPTKVMVPSMSEVKRIPGTRSRDLKDVRFTRLVAIEFQWVWSDAHGGRQAAWLCRCDCGKEIVVLANALLQKNVQSCGCLRAEGNHKKHGHTKGKKNTPEFSAWSSMLGRCYNPNNERYDIYGARGITVCERWRNDFLAFLMDMGPKPGNGREYSVDRIDTDGNYEPGNCRWSNPREQAINRRTTRWLTLQGRTMCMEDWAAELGWHPASILKRLKNGWSVERALTQPLKDWANDAQKLEHNGERLSISEWSNKTGIEADTIRNRIRTGWPVDLALTAPLNAKLRYIRKKVA